MVLTSCHKFQGKLLTLLISFLAYPSPVKGQTGEMRWLREDLRLLTNHPPSGEKQGRMWACCPETCLILPAHCCCNLRIEASVGSLPQLIIFLGRYVHAVKHVRKYCLRPPKNASYCDSRAVTVELEEEISDVIGRGLRTV